MEPGFSFQWNNRYNPAGKMSAVYLCDDRRRAPEEANLAFGHELYEVVIERLPRVVRLDRANLGRLGLTRADVTRPRISTQAYEHTHPLALGTLQADGAGLMVPSALPGATENDWNLVLLPVPLILSAAVRGWRPVHA